MHRLPGFEWWNFQIFTTTKIFVVVILFGAGTDYCLFLISRYKEELDAGRDRGVGHVPRTGWCRRRPGRQCPDDDRRFGARCSLPSSASFATAGRRSACALTVTLLACVTLAPALLRALGPAIFWPFGSETRRRGAAGGAPQEAAGGFWDWLSHADRGLPGSGAWSSAPSLMAPLAVLGTQVQVTYDFLSELEPRGRANRVRS